MDSDKVFQSELSSKQWFSSPRRSYIRVPKAPSPTWLMADTAGNLSVVSKLSVLERRLTGLVTSLPPVARTAVRTDLRQLAAVFHQLAVTVPVRA